MKKQLYLLTSLLLLTAAKAQVLETAPLSQALTMPAGLRVMNGKLYFAANSSVHGKELFSTNGTAVGTELVKEIGNYFNVPIFSAFTFTNSLDSEGYFGELNGKMYFRGNVGQYNEYKFWVSDGTGAGTMLFSPAVPLYDQRWFKEYNGKLYFTARTAANGFELWSTDGTDAGTVIVKDINPGNGNAFSGNDPKFFIFNNKLWFTADDGTHGVELWSTDGTIAGTVLLKDINTGYYVDPAVKSAFSTANRKPFIVNGSSFYFEAFDGLSTSGGLYTLYKSDGTPDGTVPIKAAVVQSGFIPSYYSVSGMTAFNDAVYFFATTTAFNGGVQNGLWKINADNNSASYIYQVKGYGDNGLSDGIPHGSMREYNGKLYFVGYTNSTDSHFWSTDGTTAGTAMVKQFKQNTSSFDTQQFMRSIVYNNKLYFVAGTFADENVYSTDGTTAGTAAVFASNMAFGPQQFTIYGTAQNRNANAAGDDLYFSATPNLSYELWRLRNEELSAVDFTTSAVKVYPTLTASTITIAFKDAVAEADINLINMTGQRVYSKSGISVSEFSFDVSTLPSGVYLLQSVSNGGTFTTKIIRQ